MGGGGRREQREGEDREAWRVEGGEREKIGRHGGWREGQGKGECTCTMYMHSICTYNVCTCTVHLCHESMHYCTRVSHDFTLVVVVRVSLSRGKVLVRLPG